MNKYQQIIVKIIKEQEQLMGPIAWNEAGKVPGLKIVDRQSGNVAIEGASDLAVVDNLVTQYGNLFGRAAREVCKDAVASMLADFAPTEIPSSLK